MAFADDLSFRQLTSEEMYEVAGRPDILEIQRFREEYDRRKQ
jgi:hypothetical protein